MEDLSRLPSVTDDEDDGPKDDTPSTGAEKRKADRKDAGSDPRPNLERPSTASLRIDTSFDSETDSGPFTLTSTPLHAMQEGQISQMPSSDTDDPHIVPQPSDSLGETFEQRPTFDMVDDSDFEILPDDDDAREDFAANKGGLPPLTRRSSAPDTRSKPFTSQPRSPDQSPPASPPTSPPTSPTTRKLLTRIKAPLSPSRQRGSWRHSAQQHHDDSLVPAPGERKPPRAHRRIQTSTDGFSARSPLPGPFRAIRARAMAAYRGTDSSTAPSIEQSMSPDDQYHDDVSSSEAEVSLDADEISSDEESDVFDDLEDDDKLDVDFSSITPMPNSFLDIPPDLYDYLDTELVKNISEQNISTFAYEHHLLVKGLLQLLAERDIVGVEGDIDNTSNVIKMGPLKKRTSRGLWPVKYVEIRRGNLSYFPDDAIQKDSASRKTIHLRKRTCRCELAEDVNPNTDSFIFELMVEGGPKKMWMAKSEEERQGWIRAVNQAMIGETEVSQDSPVDLSLYQNAIDSYQYVRGSLKQVESRRDYLIAVDSLLYRKTASSALRVPMSWVRDDIIQRGESHEDVDSIHARFKCTVSENWRFLSNTTVDINGFLIAADTLYSAERVIGTLSRFILEFDRVDDSEIGSGVSMKTVKRTGKDAFMTEVEAVSYARSILLGALRTQSQGDVLAAVKNLMQNESVALVELEKSEPLHIDVSFAGDDFLEPEQKPYDMSGWLMTKLKRGKVWKRRFFVVSEGVLSFFAEAEPRPYGLRGQIVLGKCTIESMDEETLAMTQEDEEERCLQFEDRGAMLKWRTVLERASDQECPPRDSSPEPERRRMKRNSIVYNVKPIKAATGTGVKVGKRAMKAMKGAKIAGMKKIQNARGIIARGMRQRGQGEENEDRRTSTHAMLMMSTRGLAGIAHEKREPTVQAITELNSAFRVMPVPATEGAEPLLIIRVKLYQAFLMSGGANGRMSCGDELIEMEFLGTEDGNHEFLEAPTSL